MWIKLLNLWKIKQYLCMLTVLRKLYNLSGFDMPIFWIRLPILRLKLPDLLKKQQAIMSNLFLRFLA